MSIEVVLSILVIPCAIHDLQAVVFHRTVADEQFNLGVKRITNCGLAADGVDWGRLVVKVLEGGPLIDNLAVWQILIGHVNYETEPEVVVV